VLHFVALVLSIVGSSAAVIVGPALPNAHAHNDYAHKRPLLDALFQGFTSIEADVYLVDGRLLVAHDREGIDPAKTLERLYLDPLKELAAGKQSIFGKSGTLTLLIDFKSEAEATYEALKSILPKYSEMLTVFDGETIQTNAITIILSGHRPKEKLLSEKRRLAAFDGRLSDLGRKHLVSFMPLVSDNWNNHFEWRGDDRFPGDEKEKLRNLVQQAHSEGRRIRFWATPEKNAVWRELRDAGIDLISTDDLAGLADFLRKGK
jgi:glycerophosphoryl diester phosphodiesterase